MWCTLIKPRGRLIVVSGPGGAGKNTLINATLPRLPELLYSVSATTRPPRPGERHGVNYFFHTQESFQGMIDRDELLEWADFCGYRYGTPKAFVEERLAAGQTIITDIDIQGAAQIRRRMPDGVFVFLLPPTVQELKRRIQQRGADSEAGMTRRLEAATSELEAIGDYDYYVLNDDIERAANQLVAIITAERCRIMRASYRDLIQAFYEGDFQACASNAMLEKGDR